MKKYTPMIRQYLDIKADYEDSLLFFRLGDFYELFFNDAVVAADELNLVLTARNNADEKIPMCGVPHHASASYIYRLAQKGHKIAIVEQLENPEDAEGIVKRGVVKVVTPGTIMDELNDNSESIYLASVIEYAYGYAVSLAEMASGKVIVFNVEKDIEVLIASLRNYNTKEIIILDSLNNSVKRELLFLDDILLSEESEVNVLSEYAYLYNDVSNTYLKDSVELLLSYLNKTQMKMLNHLREIEVLSDQNHLKINYNSVHNLELIESLKSGNVKNSLWDFLDYTETSMGKRLLRDYIIKPMINKSEILKRQSEITIIKDDYILFADLKENLSNIYDLERLNAKLSYGNANPLDLLRLKRSLASAPKLIESLIKYPQFKYLANVDTLNHIVDLIESAILEDVKANIREGGIFKTGFNSDLDKAHNIQRDGQSWILELEAKERARTDISNLKVGYNRVFGYFIEVSKGNVAKIKDEFNYIRKQTLTNSERYITEELKMKEEEILNADDIAKEMEFKLFNELVKEISTYSKDILALSDVIANIDTLYSLANVARLKGYVLPTISDDREFNIVEGRHPILENLLRDHTYVSNNLNMSNEDVWLITGPNMGGKSTFMRQSVLIVILAQMGSYVPATSASIPIFDQIFTRVGASDDILSGKSTFMVEMSEANDALSNATENSLIIFDEIGRGTSTYDGMAIAKSMIEYIATNIKAKTLFSTHYHELVTLADSFDNVSNYHLLVHEENDEITLKYEVVPGISNRSYGINVARLANLPDHVINRASSILEVLEKEQLISESGHEIIYKEVEVVPNNLKKVETLLKEVNINDLTPMNALQLLDDLVNKLNGDRSYE